MLLEKGAEQQAAAKKVKPFFPNQDGRGTYMNISGVDSKGSTE